MRAFAILVATLSVIGPGCGGAGPTTPPGAGLPPEQESARVFGLAEGLEKQGKAKQAFAAYHQVVRNFPGTPSAGKASARIGKAQKEAMRKAR